MIIPSGTELEITARGIVMNYNDSGDKKNPTIIFIHGFPFDKNMWNNQLAVLGNEFRCIAYDLSGYGRSAPRNQFSIEEFADDLDAFMDILQIPNAAICGLSMGGYIALRAYDKYPERFSQLILCDTQCVADTEEGKEKRFKSIRQIEEEGLENYASGFVKNVFTEESQLSKKEITEKIKATILSTAPASVTGTLKALAERAETCTNLSEIKVPVLILCGKEDKVTPVAQSEYLNRHIPGSVYSVIENASHLSNLEQPETFNEAIRKFLVSTKEAA
jgi:3-oxoadipate enol-lactonase